MEKLIEGCIHHYITAEGVIRNAKTGRIKKPWVGKNGYLCIDIWENNTGRKLYVHRILCLTFLRNPENKRTVNHKDGNKLNNCVSNLEWATDSENIQHAHNNGLNKGSKKVFSSTIEKASEMFFGGATITSIAKHFGVVTASISIPLKKYAVANGIEAKYDQEKLRQKTLRNRKVLKVINEKRSKQTGI